MLVGVGLDVTGAFLGTAFSLIAVGLVLLIPLRRQLEGVNPELAADLRLRELLAGAWVPVCGLTLLLAPAGAARDHRQARGRTDDAAGSYAVAAVAAKAIMWIAIGLGLYLLPEATRRAKTGEDARPILLRTLGLIAAMAVPAVLIYSVAGEPLLRIVFGEDLTEASDALPFLGPRDVAARLLVPVGAVPARDGQGELPVRARRRRARGGALLLSIGDDLTAIAIALLGIQASAPRRS